MQKLFSADSSTVAWLIRARTWRHCLTISWCSLFKGVTVVLREAKPAATASYCSNKHWNIWNGAVPSDLSLLGWVVFWVCPSVPGSFRAFPLLRCWTWRSKHCFENVTISHADQRFSFYRFLTGLFFRFVASFTTQFSMWAKQGTYQTFKKTYRGNHITVAALSLMTYVIFYSPCFQKFSLGLSYMLWAAVTQQPWESGRDCSDH